MTPEQAKRLKSAMADINKRFGAGSINKASRVAFASMTRIPFGIFNVDVATGGGLPKGRVMLLIGEESVGKTTLCMCLIANFQHTCRKCLKPFKWYTDEKVNTSTGEVTGEEMIIVEPCPCGENEPHVAAYFDAEGAFDPMWAASLGVDVPSLLIVQPETAEQGVDSINALIRTGALDFLAVDSIAAMTPAREVEKGAEGGQRPDLALIMNYFMRNLQSSLNSLGMDNPNKPSVVLVNQFREKVGVMYGDPRTWPGGKGQNFAASIIMSMRKGKPVDADGNVGGKKDPKVGVELFFEVMKNKTFPPYKKGSFRLFNQDWPVLNRSKGEVDNFEQMIEYAANIGMIQRAGAWYDMQTEFGPEFTNPGSPTGRFQGVNSIIDFLKANPHLVDVAKDKIMQLVRMNNTVATSSAAVPDSDDDEDEE